MAVALHEGLEREHHEQTIEKKNLHGVLSTPSYPPIKMKILMDSAPHFP
jgi:hypothetical protein